MNGRPLNLPCRQIVFRSFLACVLVLAAVLPGSGSAALPWNGAVGSVRKPNFTGEGAKACLSCHFGEKMQAIAASPHGDEANPATPYGKEGCESCHGPGSFHVSRAHGGKGFPKLLSFGRGPGFSSRQEQLGACLACHEDEHSGSPLIGYTDSVHDMSSINCSRCHEAHTRTQRVSEPAHQAGVCFSCHRKQKDGHPLLGRRPVDFKTQSCSNCHDVHPAAK